MLLSTIFYYCTCFKCSTMYLPMYLVSETEIRSLLSPPVGTK